MDMKHVTAAAFICIASNASRLNCQIHIKKRQSIVVSHADGHSQNCKHVVAGEISEIYILLKCLMYNRW